MNLEQVFPKLSQMAESMHWEAKEVVRDIDGKPHLLERITLTGPIFEHRALEPFVRVGEIQARIVDIDEDGRMVKAYFDQMLPDEQPIEFGYHGEGVLYRFPVSYQSQVGARLDIKRLAKDVVILQSPKGSVH